ncbi:MAG TPA: ATP-binding protein [Stenomitos sp.]
MRDLPRLSYRTWFNFFRRAWHNLNFARKLLISGVAAVFLVAGALTVITYISAEDSLRTQTHRQVHNELKVLERLYSGRTGEDFTQQAVRLYPELAQRSCDEMVYLMGGFSAVFAGTHPIAVSGLAGAYDRDALRLPTNLMHPGNAEGFTTATFRDTTYVVAIHRLQDSQGEYLGAFVRGIPQKQISDMLQKHAWGIFSVAGTAMLLALIALAKLTHEISAPLRRLARASRTLAAGEPLEGLPDPRGSDEVGRLETDFKAIADRLSAQKMALEEKDRLRGQLLDKLISAQEDERRRISRELHDQTGQSLTTLLVGLKVLEKAPTMEAMQARAADLMGLVHQTLDEVHRLSVELRPAMLDDLGLVAALRAMATDFEEAHGVRTEVRIQGIDHRLAPIIEASVYRVMQEALTNIAKYASAQHVTLRLVQEGERLDARVEDDGRGFDVAAVLHAKGRQSLGLLGMQERVGLLGGEFTIDSAPGHGTHIRFTIPLEIGDAVHA